MREKHNTRHLNEMSWTEIKIFMCIYMCTYAHLNIHANIYIYIFAHFH